MELSEVIGLVVTVIVALIGVSSIVFYINKKGKNSQNNTSGKNVNSNQSIQKGNNNIQAGGNVDIKTKEWKE